MLRHHRKPQSTDGPFRVLAPAQRQRPALPGVCSHFRYPFEGVSCSSLSGLSLLRILILIVMTGFADWTGFFSTRFPFLKGTAAGRDGSFLGAEIFPFPKVLVSIPFIFLFRPCGWRQWNCLQFHQGDGQDAHRTRAFFGREVRRGRSLGGLAMELQGRVTRPGADCIARIRVRPGEWVKVGEIPVGEDVVGETTAGSGRCREEEEDKEIRTAKRASVWVLGHLPGYGKAAEVLGGARWPRKADSDLRQRRLVGLRESPCSSQRNRTGRGGDSTSWGF